MTEPANETFNLMATYLDLHGDGDADRVDMTPELWDEVKDGRRAFKGRLVSAFPMTEDWPVWERHPTGEELVYCLSGEMDLVLDAPEGERTVKLTPGLGVLVPRNVWHRGVVHAPGEFLFITPGRGTEHKPV